MGTETMNMTLREEGVYVISEYSPPTSDCNDYDIPQLQMDIKDTTPAYVIEADVAGLNVDQVTVRVDGEGRTFFIGVDPPMMTTTPADTKKKQRVLPERKTADKFGRSFWFIRGFYVKDVTATMKAEVLTVTLPKREPIYRSDFKRIIF